MKSPLPSSATFDWNCWVGLPFVTRGRGPKAYDCWGLAWGVLLARGHDLPLFLEDGVATPEQMARLDQWMFVHDPTPQPFDLVIFDLGKQSLHIGVICGPQMFLHITYGKTSVVERFTNLGWRSRLKGIYRYQRNTVCGMKEKETRPMKESMVSGGVRCSVCLELLPIQQANKETRGPCEPVGRSWLMCPRCVVSIASLASPEISMSEKKR